MGLPNLAVSFYVTEDTVLLQFSRRMRLNIDIAATEQSKDSLFRNYIYAYFVPPPRATYREMRAWAPLYMFDASLSCALSSDS